MVNRIFLVFSLGLISTSLSSELRGCDGVICSDGLKCCETSDGTQTCCSPNSKCCTRNNVCCTKHTSLMNYIMPNQAFKEIGKKVFVPPFLKTDTNEINRIDLDEIKNRTMDNELDPNHNMNSQVNLIFTDIKNLAIETGDISTQNSNKVDGTDTDKISRKDWNEIKNGSTDNEPYPNHNMNSQLNLIFVDIDNLTLETGDISLENGNKVDGIGNELNATRNMNFVLNLVVSNISNVHLKTGNISMKRSNVVRSKEVDDELDVDHNSFRSLSRNLDKRWKLDIFCPGRKQKCPRSYTCCLMENETYGCCPYSEAVCCSDFAHCCPSTTVCNVTTEACVPF